MGLAGTALAAANSPCADSGTPTRFNGYTKSLASVVSAEARIEGQAPLLCINPDGTSGSFTWVGVQVSSSSRSIYQMGVAKCIAPLGICTGGYRIFYAWGRDNGVGSCTSNVDPHPLDLGPAPSGLHTYSVVRTATQIQFKLDSSVLQTIALSSVSCWTANAAVWVGESWDRGDQVGGNVGDHQQIRSALYEANVGGVWSNASFPIACNNSLPTLVDYHCLKINATGIDIWTDKS
jgi:hypothetical protein